MVIIAPSQLNPNASEPFGLPRPENYRFETHGPSLSVGEGFSIFLILSFTSVRLWKRPYKTRKFGLDDWMIIPGAIGAVIYLSLSMISHTKGCLGKHIYDCTYNEISIWVFYFSVFSVKLSIAILNRRITGLASERWMRTHYIFIGLFVILLPPNVCLEAFQCTPPPVRYSLIYISQMEDPRRIKRLNPYAISLSGRLMHIITDVALLCVPIMSRSKRLTFCSCWSRMSTIASIVRTCIISNNLVDVTCQLADVSAWNYIDITFGIVVASLPALNTLLHAAISRLKTHVSNHSTGTSMPRITDHSSRRGNSKGHSAHRTPSVAIQMEVRPSTVDTKELSLGYLSNPKPGQSLDDFLLREDALSHFETGSQETLHRK
ncbi:hypothetical protein BU23DRAFT_458162 [Bimuria novae-zelandiae CBS 107.79]|uniref:Rhodopsin domain-containing protein n=1 Tax=Bimuria novae-zelandiae CBS 107.79 TaxID=1447943 RepID=A0A6A5VEA5_9PLEO|nr:hypothetical protein BU23DRAFT_458162 [Bimuria novae-zelandiae CBS 107.79]